MANSYFQFKQFTVHQDRSAMKVTTDACLFGAWVSRLRQAFGDRRQSVNSRQSVLDIGTGTGLLSLMIAQGNPELVIDAIEIDKEAAEQAKDNVSASPWKNTITIINDDARTFSFTNRYDIIISNPPFYENELKSTDNKKNTAHHSEELALEELLGIIREQLKPDGSFYLLLPYKRNKAITDLLRKNEMAIDRVCFVKQSINHDYFRIMLSGKLSGDNIETNIEEIAIKDGEEYTEAFKDLLKDYYLYL